MNIRTSSLAVLLVACLAPFAATAADPATNGGLATPSNRIVGTWSNVAMVGPCDSTVRNPLRQTVMFNAGGTFVDNSRFPPGGINNANGITGLNQRSIGLGDWKYDPKTDRYSLTQQFDWYVDNVYHGYQVVERSMLLSSDYNIASGPVTTVRFAANGAVVASLCGTATSIRL